MNQLDLVWHTDPLHKPTGGVVDAWVAFCSCGWRYAVSSYSRKENRVMAEELYRRHRCGEGLT